MTADESSSAEHRLHAVVHGRVHGVGYRVTTLDERAGCSWPAGCAIATTAR